VFKNVGGATTYFLYTEDGLAGEYGSAGYLIRSYVYRPGEGYGMFPALMKTPEGLEFFHNDHLGTPLRLMNKNGAVRWAGQHKAYGEMEEDRTRVTFPVDLPWVENPLRFPGQYADAETGLHQNYFRDYDPRVGGYLEADPLGLVAGLNRHGYVGGIPLVLADPLGLLTESEKAAIAGAIISSGAIIGGAIGGGAGGVGGAAACAFTGPGAAVCAAGGAVAGSQGGAVAGAAIGAVTAAGIVTAADYILQVNDKAQQSCGSDEPPRRRQIFRRFKSRKAAEDARNEAGPWQKPDRQGKPKTQGPETHDEGDPHFHDKNHEDKTKPNIHYVFPR
jgi:RHS repeat-associated protein